MAQEYFANDAETTLVDAIGADATTVIVLSADDFPAFAQYRIRIDNELLLVTAGAGSTTWTVTRGIEGTTAASHLSDSQVCQVLTAGALAQLKLDAFPSASLTGSAIRYNAGTGAWETAVEPFTFRGIVLTPALASLITAEGAIYYDSSLKAILVCTDI